MNALQEVGVAFSWPLLSDDDARRAVRVAVDAGAAHAYAPTRNQYPYVLTTFSHKDAPRQRLAAFQELQSIGLDFQTASGIWGVVFAAASMPKGFQEEAVVTHDLGIYSQQP